MLSQTQQPLAEFIEAISERFRLHEQCFLNRDARPLAESFFAPHVVWDFQGFPPVRDREGILGFYEQVVLTSTITIRPLEWRVDGSTGWSLVDYVVTFENGDPQMLLRTAFVWSHTDNGWLVDLALGYKA